MLTVYLQTVFQVGLIYGFVAVATCIAFRFLAFPDLTPDGSFVIGAVVTARLLVGGEDWRLALALAFIVGAACGIVTAALHRWLGINKFFAGILTAMALYSINLRILGSANLSVFRSANIFGIGTNDLAVSAICAAALAVTVLVVLCLFHTRLGLRLRGLGSNALALRTTAGTALSLTALGLAISNGIAAVGGSLFCQLQSFADVNMGIGVSVIGFASLFLGEAILISSGRLLSIAKTKSPKPRRIARPVFGEIFGAVLGAILLTAISTATLYFGFPPSDLKFVSAVVLIIALVFRGRQISRWLVPASKFET
jgi:putative ABC transport system permease protein